MLQMLILGQYEQTTKSFMALPLELRQLVYEGLLTPTCTRSDEKGAQFSLNPVILRVSKQICGEATEMLYERAGVILLEVEVGLVEQMWRVSANDRCHHFPKDYMLRELNDQKLWSEPIVRIKLSNTRPTWPQNTVIDSTSMVDQGLPRTFVGFSKMLPSFFRFLTTFPGFARIGVTLEVNTAADLVHQGDLQMLLHDACRLGAAVVYDSQSALIHTQIASRMVYPVHDIDSIMRGIRCRESQVERLVDAGRFDAADTAVQEAKHFLAWAAFLLLRTMKHDFKRCYRLELAAIRVKAFDLIWQDVSLDIKFRRLPKSRSKVGAVLKHMTRRYYDVSRREADRHYYLGRISLEEGNKIGALWAFFNALCKCPSHEKVNEEIDSLEVSIQGGDDLEDCVIRHNTRYVFTDLRHQDRESPTMVPDRVRELREAFVATDKQKQQATVSTLPTSRSAEDGLSYRFCCRKVFDFRSIL